MDARAPIYSSLGPMSYHAEFNISKEYFCVALEDGFAIFTTANAELYTKEELPGSIGTATMLGSTQIVGIIGGGNRPMGNSRRASNLQQRFLQKKLVLYDTSKHAAVAGIKTAAPIVRARLSSKLIAIVFDCLVVFYKHQPKIEKIATYETASNPLGLCCLGEQVAVFPGRSAGQLQMLRLDSMSVDIVPAHSTTLRAVALSPNEHLVASASDKGTLIRVHSTQTTGRVTELRRGVTPATILSIAFSPSNARLAVTSDTNTLHVFDLPAQSSTRPTRSSRSPTPEPTSSPQNKWGGLGKLPFAPRVFSDIYSFASITFDPGKESEGGEGKGAEEFVDIIPGVPGGIPIKADAAWIDEHTIALISAGRDARYERFVLLENDSAGSLQMMKDGWNRFLAP